MLIITNAQSSLYWKINACITFRFSTSSNDSGSVCDIVPVELLTVLT